MVARWLLVLTWLVFVSGCTVPCGSDDPSIAELQRLSSSYYEELFHEVEDTDCRWNCRLPALDKLRRLGNRTIFLRKLSETEAAAMLKYCFDEGLVLKFKGLGTSSGEIWITWGGSPASYGEALLWNQSGKGRADG